MNIFLTSKISGKVNGNWLEIVTAQTVGGGGSRNIITWTLLAKKQGFNNILLRAPCGNYEAKEQILKAVKYANELLNPVGSIVLVSFTN